MKQVISEVNGISITKNLIGINYTKGMLIKPKYIVIHDISDNRFTTMREYRNYIARNKEAKESVHYLVGPRNIIKILEDDWRGWHVGDKPSKEVTNSNSISIAMFIRDSKDINRTLKNVVALVNKLRDSYEIGIDNVKRHYDVTGKLCPELLLNDKAWSRFKLALKGLESELKPIAKGKIIEVLSSLNLRKDPNDESEVIGKVSSKESFNIYEKQGNWIKTAYEVEDKIIVGYLNKDYIEIEDLKENVLDDITEEEALKEISKFYKKPNATYNALEELEKLVDEKESIIKAYKAENNNEVREDKVAISVKKRDINREGTVVNIDTNLAVRRGAGDENYVIGYLLAAQKVNVMQESGDWYKIVYQSTIGKRIGFVEKDFIRLE